MNNEGPSVVPHSFIEIYLSRSRTRPIAPREIIAARYDLCEDMAQMLTEHARGALLDLGITEQLVLDRIHRGLLAEGSVVSEDEARWVTFRLAELLGWTRPDITRTEI